MSKHCSNSCNRIVYFSIILSVCKKSILVVNSERAEVKMYCTILALSLVLLSVSSEQINITNEYDLENFLCNGTHSLDDDIQLVLSDKITHLISNNVSFCVINDTNSLTLTSESSKQAVVQCNDSSTLPNSGFAFTNIHSLTLIRLVFTGCGEELKRLAAIESINSSASPMHFSQYHSAVLVFLHINTLFIDEVNVTNYYGFAILAINPMTALINNCSITLSYGGKTCQKEFGSGLFLLFTDVASSGNCTVTIQHSMFSNNFEYYNQSICDSYQKNNQKHLPIINAAGLSVFHLQKTFTVYVQVMQSQFISNRGILAGTVLVLYYNSVEQSQITISNATFKDNFSNNGCYGSDLSFIFYVNRSIKEKQQNRHQLYVSNSSFSSDMHYSQAKETIYLYIYDPSKEINVTLNLSHVNITSIATKGTGLCLHAVSDISDSLARNGTAQIILTDITAVRNIQLLSLYTRDYHQSIFVIENFDYIFLTGNSTYTNNRGSVFGISNTKVILDGRLHFENNTGNSGSAFMLTGSSRFILKDGLYATFIHNVAFTTGGAIYAYNDITSECMFTASGPNVTMLFINNSAIYSGNSIFSNNLYSCSTIKNFDPVVAKKFYHALSRGTIFNNKTDDKQLSTVAFKQIICYNDTSNFMNKNKGIVVYPGMMLHFPTAVLDVFNQSTSTDVSLSLLHNEYYRFKTISPEAVPSENWYVTPNIINLSENNCTTVNFTIFKRTEHDIPFLVLSLLMSTQGLVPEGVTHLAPKHCPAGFEFDNSTHKCECSHVLHKIDYQPVCKISSDGYNPLITINLVTSFICHSTWIGTLDNGTVFGISSHCYIYCRYKNNHNAFVISDSVGSINVMIANSSNCESLCLDNREGPLCSQCTPGYSVTFGSNQCEKCSYWWLLTLIAYGLAGPLLIYLLYALNLTLTTGKLNGIIFYSQMLNNTNILLHYQNAAAVNHGFVKFIFFCSRGILLLINLNISFNIPLCFYDGMTEILKSGLGLLFPVYLLSIVIGLIIISRYSVRLSNRIANSSIQVLVTVVHLSFSTLLTSLIDVFTPVYIHTNTSDVPLVVWQNDGTVEYGKGSHLILMIVTGLVVGTILTTYLTVLLAGRPLMKINRIREYLRPIYEAIHAPYKPNREFLFSFSTIFIALTYLISTISIGTNPALGVAVGVSVICLYLNIVGFSHPFKSMHLNVLNTVIYSAIIILLCSFWSIVDATASIKWAILATFSHLIIIIILICVIMSQFSFGKKLFNRINELFVNIKFKFVHPIARQENLQQCDSFYQSCNEREPLLNS